MENLKLGMAGLDTSRCEAVASLLHNEDGEYYVPEGRIVAACPGGARPDSNELIPRVLEFSRAGKSPVCEEMPEITAFLEAADKSTVAVAVVQHKV